MPLVTAACHLVSPSFPPGNHQSRSNHYQSHANIRRQHFIVMRVHAQMNISGVNAVTLGVRHRNEERQNSQRQNYESDYEETFHGY